MKWGVEWVAGGGGSVFKEFLLLIHTYLTV